ncbi:hypothetical protein [Flavobacterium sp. JP2137]|uniref:hypothetical protein n=1 Tax=Flavobacterium sp. JP2137 TaxID=3414510 RepID=UPI003D2FA4A3
MDAVAAKEVLQQEYNRHILMLLDQGYKVRQISVELAVSVGMVNKRIGVLKKSFEVEDHSGLLREAKILGFV